MLKKLLLLSVLGCSNLYAETVLVVGDSLSAAYGLAVSDGWVAKLETRLQTQAPSWKVVNASISGDTTSGGLQRLPALLTAHQPEILIVELGGNDGLRGTPLATVRQNIDRLVQSGFAAGAKVVLLGIQIPPNYGPVYADRFAGIYDQLAEQYQGGAFAYVPRWLESIAVKPELMQADGIHPNEGAQAQMMMPVWQVLEPWL